MVDRVSSLDDGYVSGDLSVYPDAIDDKDILYEAKNNAQTQLKQSVGFNGKKIIVDDASIFPSKGLLRIGPPAGEAGNSELIYYDSRTNTTFSELIRAFAGSVQHPWDAGSYVSNAVMAEHHNAVKDAIINIENYVGLETNPNADSLNGRLKTLENKFLSPKPLFRSFPRKGSPPLSVRFQNFSGGDVVRYFWDFGDGTTSILKSPFHTYQQEGIYTVKLSIITSNGAQGVVTKNNYIEVSEDNTIQFFYVAPSDSNLPNYSVETASNLSTSPQEFEFVDQSDGEIVQRFWIFDDGQTESITDPDIHSVTHTYDSPGEYEPSLLLVLSTQQLRRVFLKDTIIVL